MEITEFDGVKDCLERVRSGWNSGDAHVFAQQFTEDATYVIYLGEALLGRGEIEKNHVDVLGKWEQGTKMAIKVLNINRLDDRTVSVLTAGGIGKGSTIRYDKLQTFTVVNRDGHWLCSAFQNTAMSRRARRLYNPGGVDLLGRLLSLLGRNAK